MSPNRLRRSLIALAGAALLAGPLTAGLASAADVTVFAAASLKNALDNAVAAYKTKTGKDIVVSYAGSSQLAKQIESGAPADIFFSADLDWMDYLAKKDLIDRGIARDAARQHAGPGRPEGFDRRRSRSGKDFPLLAEALGKPTASSPWAASPPCRPANMARPRSTEARRLDGRRAARRRRPTMSAPRSPSSPRARHRSASSTAPTRNAEAGGQGSSAPSPQDSHPPIVYPVALTKSATGAEAKAFLDYLLSPEAKPAFEAEGFAILGTKG